MCGISGHIDWRHRLDESAIRLMTTRISHRGPDDHGVWSSPDGHCVLGHARLSVLDLSTAGHQPMCDPLTGNVIVYNGEIYNFRELRKECEQAGVVFTSGTDTEVILALYRRFGTRCLESLRGMFAFVLWDQARQSVFIARDRVGKKPLNYAVGEHGLVFCSEIDPLVRHPAVSSDLDMEALNLYLQLQYIPAPWSIYRSIRKLPPAHYAVYNRDGLQLHEYWSVDYRSKVKLSEQEALDGLDEKLREAVRLRMVSDVPVGALLSGGVDSSVVVAMMAGLRPDPVKTFSIGFREAAFSELPYAAMVASRYGTDHSPQIIDAGIDAVLGKVVQHYGEPFADSSAIPSFRVCEIAREQVKVVLIGDGGDELLGGYPYYWLNAFSIMAGQFIRDVSPEYLARTVSTLHTARSIPARARRKWLLRVAHPELQLMMSYSSFWSDAQRRELAGPDGAVVERWRREWLGRSHRAAGNAIDRMLWMDNGTYLPGDLMVKMDIASMHCGLEARSPLLDHKVIEYCAALPVDLKVRGATGKYLLKRLAERYLPRELIYRRKMGFAVPLADWLQGALRPVIREVLTDRTLMEPLDPDVIRQTMSTFLAGSREESSRIWALVMFGLWRRHVNSRPNVG
ncbi:MAG: asparagine synthase (glutamine-hydrolyzing) [Gammaproteobacteria bacterium]